MRNSPDKIKCLSLNRANLNRKAKEALGCANQQEDDSVLKPMRLEKAHKAALASTIARQNRVLSAENETQTKALIAPEPNWFTSLWNGWFNFLSTPIVKSWRTRDSKTK
mmetsp:Transcript_12651/g.22788  ORF Transcript_12651/g.22788 Transcript_12651/m.22788 type:complete len:109 (-) Transcript_12651:1328-1654(-)